MDQTPETLRARRSNAWGWWAVLAVLAFALPQCSLLAAKAISLIPMGNSVNRSTEVLVSFAVLGISTSLSFASGLVILAFIMLHGGSRWKRFCAAAGYLLAYALTSLIVLLATNYRWMVNAMSSQPDHQSVIAYLVFSPSLSIASMDTRHKRQGCGHADAVNHRACSRLGRRDGGRGAALA